MLAAFIVVIVGRKKPVVLTYAEVASRNGQIYQVKSAAMQTVFGGMASDTVKCPLSCSTCCISAIN